jgi:hypothetical protein
VFVCTHHELSKTTYTVLVSVNVLVIQVDLDYTDSVKRGQLTTSVANAQVERSVSTRERLPQSRYNCSLPVKANNIMRDNRLTHSPHLPLWLSLAAMLLMFGLAVHSLVQKSPTMDEQGFLVRGLGYVRDENRWMRVGHPAGLNVLNAWLLKDDETVKLPIDDPSWQTTEFHRPAELFLWEIGNDVEHIMFLARLPTVWIGLLMVAIIGRFARELSFNAHKSRQIARWSALLAITVVAFDPNILAHTRLVTTDLGLVAGIVLATYLLWRFLRTPGWINAILAGVGFGLLINTKFTAGLFVPLFLIVILVGIVAQWREGGSFPAKMVLQLIVAYPLVSFITLWAAYGFDVGTLPQELPAFSDLIGGQTLPLAHYLDQFADIGGRVAKATPAFLLGSYSDNGWWYYFPVAFLLKTPLPTLGLLMLAIGATLLPKKHRKSALNVVDYAAILVPPLGYFAFSMTTDINIGYRHILVVVPFMALFVARQMPFWKAAMGRFGRIIPAITIALVTLLIISTVWIAPHFLAYFNMLAGGPDNGWKALVDSNIDWGQDLSGLAEWVETNDSEQIWLSYFGEGRPEYYGINYTGLPSYPPRLTTPDAQWFFPYNPAPGIYAISASNLQGVLFEDHDLLAWFRDKEPIDKIGYSIFLYDVAPDGQPTDLVMGGTQVSDINPSDYAQLATNDVTLHWFDPQQAFLLPDKPGGWLVTSEVLTGNIESLYEEVVSAKNTPYTLYRDTRTEPGLDFGSAQPVGATFTNDSGGAITLHAFTPTYSVWQQQGDATSLKLFIHVEDSAGNIVTQFDGLGAQWAGFRTGDWLVQQHKLDIAALIPGNYSLYAGVYDPDTGVRWQSENGDRIRIGEVTYE